jgi:hypothetical protein
MTGQLVLSEERVRQMQWRKTLATSGVAIVGKTPEGKYETITKFGFITKYKVRFEVDISSHHDVVKSSLPSRGDAFYFDCRFALDWQVTNAAAVVEYRIDDGLELCYARLTERLRKISRRFEIKDCAQAESEINNLMNQTPSILPEGITVHRFFARLGMDDATRKSIQEIFGAQHDNVTAAVKSTGEQVVRDIEQEGDLRRNQQRMEAMQAAMQGNYHLLAIHLSQHPDDTGSLINMIRSVYQTNEERRDNMITELLKHDLIQDIDIDELNSALLSTAAESYRSGPPRAIDLARVTALPNSSALSSNGTSQPVEPTTPTAPAPKSTNGHKPDGSGVVGWRRVEPRADDDTSDKK